MLFKTQINLKFSTFSGLRNWCNSIFAFKCMLTEKSVGDLKYIVMSIKYFLLPPPDLLPGRSFSTRKTILQDFVIILNRQRYNYVI